MIKKGSINNLHDLNVQMIGLKVEYKIQEVKLKDDVKTYVSQFTPGNLIRKYATPSAFLKVDDKLNISSKLMSMVLPMLMNSTVFRGSGFLTKTLVGLATSKVGKTLDAEHLSAIFNSIKGLFGSKKKKAKGGEFIDYGIPPDSETF
ncbi:hypothetical protein [Pedobacter antarcticus]|uniref:Uncharacterized protein n=1 Tax=Pedobacter antarcticus TaxID=34086 RepID=A0A1I2CK27_9SPHI|nr:hypothetical protein [Pedobacter antarcticus]SDM49480.1 hypothetical protein SAMN04488084_107133 [Pedobacter antarcticus]SFE68697.1 hypothetical protein SAMN03003324_01095 [Pedobacter antarcticus]